MYLPEKFCREMKELLQEEYQEYLACFERPRYYGLRVNPLKISSREFQEIAPFLLTPIPWIANGFYYDGKRDHPGRHPYYHAGLYYLQEPSAMTPASRLPVLPGDQVLDLCAAPGGKATELGAKLKGEGMLVANDISRSRAKSLLKNLELFGIPNLMVVSAEAGKLLERYAGWFDKVLIDAPCSGEGMFRKEPKMIKAWEEHGPEFFHGIQRKLIVQGADFLKPGGMLLYSTCTFNVLENEGTIQHLLKERKEMELIPMEGYQDFVPGKLPHTYRLFPHRIKGEGHFLALLRKKETAKRAEDFCRQTVLQGFGKEAGRNLRKEKNSKKCTEKLPVPSEALTFLRQCKGAKRKMTVTLRGNSVYAMPDQLSLPKGLHFLRTGLYLGEIKKNRFEPSQALAMCLKEKEYPYTLSFSLEDERVNRYLKGESIEVKELPQEQDRHWHLVMAEGFPLGFGKVVDGVLKNKYPSGWRISYDWEGKLG